jgi:hypothetical protein
MSDATRVQWMNVNNVSAAMPRSSLGPKTGTIV